MNRSRDYHVAAGLANGAKECYCLAFLFIERFLREEGQVSGGTALTTQTVDAFFTYIRLTPSSPKNGKRMRAGVV